MSGFGDQVRSFGLTVTTRNQRVFVNTAAAVQNSITNGSPITGSPGQPVQTGHLKASWQLTFPSQQEALISTNTVYAPQIEDGISWRGTPLTLRSAVGGFHSVKLTVLNFDRLVAAEAQK
jgi:hypothetical protein